MINRYKTGGTSLDNNFFDKNIRSLKSSVLQLQALPQKISDKVSLIMSNSGKPTLRCENILLHSRYDPEKEAILFAKKIKKGDNVCLYGFGLGYHLHPILDRIGPDGHLLVIELNPDILSAALKLTDHTKVLADSRFNLIYGTEEVEVSREISKTMDRLAQNQNSQLEVVFHPASFKCIPSHFPSLANALEVLLLERRFPTIFGDLEKSNYLSNQDIVESSPGINTIQNLHKGKPGILVSAGPSLDLAMPHLHRLKNKFLISCVDTSYPILLESNIQPEFVFSLDPQKESAEYFIENIGKETKLIFTPTSNPAAIQNFTGDRYVVFKDEHWLTKKNKSAMKEKGTTQAGASVACLGLDALIHFGCDPIYLVGQDCAFTGNRYYSNHSLFNKQLQSQIFKTTCLKSLHKEKSREKKQLSVKCTQGNFLLTDQVMYSYLRTLEDIIKANPKTRVFNLYSHGAKIEQASVLGSVTELMHFSAL